MGTSRGQFLAAPYGRVWIWTKRDKPEILQGIWPYRSFDQTGKFVHEIKEQEQEQEESDDSL